MTVTERTVGALAVIAAWSLIASLAPTTSCEGSLQPACLGYRLVPMFRAYARIGIVASLFVSLLAGYAVALLASWPADGWLRPPAIRWVLVTTLAVAAFEYWPFAGARDILPTTAHRWLADQSDPIRVFDCIKWTPTDAALPWLMHKEVQEIREPFEGCDEPQLTEKLAALGYQYVIARNSVPALWPGGAAPDGLERVRTFPDAEVYKVTAVAPPIVVLNLGGFFGWEGPGPDRWRWMGQSGSWTILNTTNATVDATLTLDLQSFAGARRLSMAVDGRELPAIDAGVSRRQYIVGPMPLTPGGHGMTFQTVEPAAKPIDLVDGSTDGRPLALGFYQWRWQTR